MHFASVALFALLVATTVDLVVESLVAPVPPEMPSAARGGPATGESAALDLAQLSRVTGLRLPSEVPPADQGSGASAGPVRTALRVKLLGTLLGTDTSWSIASVLDLARQKASTVMVGDRVQDAQVVEILRDRVIIARNGRRELIGSEAGEGALGPSPDVTTRGLADPIRATGTGIRLLAENQYEVPRSELEEALRHLDKVATQALIAPAYKDGQPEGFKLSSIRPDSLFSRIGILNGDVIKRINGFEMNSPENALEAYTRLKDANRIDIELDRQGSSLRKTYSIR